MLPPKDASKFHWSILDEKNNCWTITLPSVSPKYSGEEEIKCPHWCDFPLPERPTSHTLSIQSESLVILREERVTQLQMYLMHTGKDAVLNPSVALWVSDCLLSYFHLLSSSTALFSSHLKSKGNKASAHPQLYSMLVQEDDPTTLPHAQRLTKTHVCAHEANNPGAKHMRRSKYYPGEFQSLAVSCQKSRINTGKIVSD